MLSACSLTRSSELRLADEIGPTATPGKPATALRQTAKHEHAVPDAASDGQSSHIDPHRKAASHAKPGATAVQRHRHIRRRAQHDAGGAALHRPPGDPHGRASGSAAEIDRGAWRAADVRAHPDAGRPLLQFARRDQPGRVTRASGRGAAHRPASARSIRARTRWTISRRSWAHPARPSNRSQQIR